MEGIDSWEKKISQYLSGNISEPEIASLFDWIRESDNNKRIFAEYKKTWLTSLLIDNFSSEKIVSAREKVELKINNIELNLKLNHAKRLQRLWAVAASFLLAISSFSIYYAFHENRTFFAGHGLPERDIEVPYNSKSQLVLPDNSKVWIDTENKY